MAKTALARSRVCVSTSPVRQRLSIAAQRIRYRTRSSCVGIAEAGTVFAVFVSIADKLLSAELAGQTVVCFPLHLFRVGIPPSVPAPVGAEVFRFSALSLQDRLSTSAAPNLYRILWRMAADVGADGIDGKPKGNRNVCGTLVMAAHEIQRLDFLFGHMRNLPDLICGVITLLNLLFLCVRPRAVAQTAIPRRL